MFSLHQVRTIQWSTSGSDLLKQAVHLCERVCDRQVEELCKVVHCQPLCPQLPGSSGHLLQRRVGDLRSQPADTQPRRCDLAPRVAFFQVRHQTRGGKKLLLFHTFEPKKCFLY